MSVRFEICSDSSRPEHRRAVALRRGFGLFLAVSVLLLVPVPVAATAVAIRQSEWVLLAVASI